MERATTLSPRSRSGLATVVLAVLVPVLLWTGTGNTFAAHMGAGPDRAAHGAAAEVAAGPGQVSRTAVPDDATGTVPHDAGSSHVLHLLGGCIAVLGAALLLLGAWRSSQTRPDLPVPSAVIAAATGHRARSWWRPPALSPPTTSPVLRT